MVQWSEDWLVNRGLQVSTEMFTCFQQWSKVNMEKISRKSVSIYFYMSRLIRSKCTSDWLLLFIVPLVYMTTSVLIGI